MTAKQRKAQLEAFDRVVAGMGRHTREELLARLESYERDRENPPWMTLNPKYRSVYMRDNEPEPRDQNGTGAKHGE